MPEPRTYDTQAACPVARTLNVVGDRWTILVLRDLSRGRQRFSTLLESLKRVPSNLLSNRLKRLERHGMVERVREMDVAVILREIEAALGKEEGPVRRRADLAAHEHLEGRRIIAGAGVRRGLPVERRGRRLQAGARERTLLRGGGLAPGGRGDLRGGDQAQRGGATH